MGTRLPNMYPIPPIVPESSGINAQLVRCVYNYTGPNLCKVCITTGFCVDSMNSRASGVAVIS